MAAVTLANSKVRFIHSGEFAIAMIVPPATMNSADTIDLTNLLKGRKIGAIAAWNSTSGATCTCTLITNTITVDAAGGLNSQQYHIQVSLVKV